MSHQIHFFDLEAQQKDKNTLDGVIIPVQTHANTIIEIITGDENLHDCDGLISSNDNTFSLGIQTADCAAICFYDKQKYGVIHAGWRGLVNGIIEKMLDMFDKPSIFVAPLLNSFEIQKDDCYRQIANKFGTQYFSCHQEQGKEIILFHFLEAIKSLLPPETQSDGRNTFDYPKLASWRRDRNRTKRNYTVITHAPNA